MMKKSIFLIIFLFTGLNSFGQLLPQLRGVDCNRSNTQLYQNLYANITGGVQYRFKVTNNTTLVTDSITKATRGFNLNELPSLNRYNCTYDVQVQMDNGSGFGAYGNICNPSTVAITTKLRSADCGKNLPTIGTTVYASLSTADSWDFEVRNVTDPATTEVVSGLPTRAFALTMASAPFQLNNQEYEVRVRTLQGGVIQPWGDWCSLFTPAIIAKLRNSDCGLSLSSINYPVYANVTSADSWDFEVRNVTDPATTEIVSSSDREFRLTDASAQYQLFNEEYEIRVRTTQGGAVQPWGVWCSVFTPNVAPPEITDGCGNTFNYLAYEFITCTDVSATTYRWRLRIGSTVVDTVNTSTNQVRIADFLDNLNQPLYDYGTTYNISAQADIGGTWTAYGNACSVTTAAEPLTDVQFECGNTLASLNQPIIFYAIFNATNYEYEVTDLTGSDGVQTLSKSTKSFSFNELGNFSYGHDYSIRCRVTFKGTQYGYGSACTVSSPPPVIKLRNADCPKTLTFSTQNVYANNSLTFDNPGGLGLDPVNSYRFRIGAQESPWQTSRGINLQTILGAPPSASTGYNIEVQVTYDGVVQPYGAACTVTTPSSMIVIDDGLADENKNTFAGQSDLIQVFPNPSNDVFIVKPIKENNDERLELRLYDLKGTLIEIPDNVISSTGLSEVRLGKDLIQGIYYLHVYSESGGIESIQLIKL